MLSSSQATIVTETLRVALAAAAGEVPAEHLRSLAEAAAAFSPPEPRPAHPALPGVGRSVVRDLVVDEQDTAGSMGHPDPAVRVLGSPRLALWFEVVSCGLLPEPTHELSHLGAGILVHHLGGAGVGDTVTVECTCASVSGRRVVLTCTARVGDRVVGLGVHHRVLVVRAAEPAESSEREVRR